MDMIVLRNVRDIFYGCYRFINGDDEEKYEVLSAKLAD